MNTIWVVVALLFNPNTDTTEGLQVFDTEFKTETACEAKRPQAAENWYLAFGGYAYTPKFKCMTKEDYLELRKEYFPVTVTVPTV